MSLRRPRRRKRVAQLGWRRRRQRRWRHHRPRCADALGRSVGRGREDDVFIEVTQSLACPRRTASSSCRVFSLQSLRAVRALVRADCDPRRPRNARGARDARGLVVLAAAADKGVEMWANRLFSPLIVSSFLLAPRGEASPFRSSGWTLAFGRTRGREKREPSTAGPPHEAECEAERAGSAGELRAPP